MCVCVCVSVCVRLLVRYCKSDPLDLRNLLLRRTRRNTGKDTLRSGMSHSSARGWVDVIKWSLILTF
uniref:Putative secreted protein n=1 Tax=Anopheles darlingi TaxID=43151 RepID=A0A2M4DKL1_ANODA